MKQLRRVSGAEVRVPAANQLCFAETTQKSKRSRSMPGPPAFAFNAETTQKSKWSKQLS